VSPVLPYVAAMRSTAFIIALNFAALAVATAVLAYVLVL
jgi:hypothetical protein